MGVEEIHWKLSKSAHIGILPEPIRCNSESLVTLPLLVDYYTHINITQESQTIKN
jgi:hypothetical protein